MKWIMNVKYLIAVVLCATLSFAVSGVAANTSAQGATTPVMIQAVKLKGDGGTSELVVSTSTPATYTSYKTSSPHRLIIDFSQAIPAESLADLNVAKGPVKGVTLKRFDTDAGVLTRMEVFLTQDIEPIITPSVEKHGELRISFPGYKPDVTSEPTKPVGAATSLDDVKNVQSSKVESTKEILETTHASNSLPVVTDVVVNDGVIAILTQNPVQEFRTFRLNKPERVVVDINNAKSTVPNKIVQLNISGVSTARVGSYSDKVRVVFDAINNTLPEATFEKSPTGLNVFFAAIGSEKQSAAVPVMPVEKTVAAAQVPKEQVDTAVVKAPSTQSAAQISSIDFQVINDVSRITVKVSGSPVVDEPVKAAGTITFRIKNAQLPRNLQRSLEAREFSSPVLRVTPVQVKTKNSNDILIRVSLKVDSLFELKHEADLVYLDVKHPVSKTKMVEPVSTVTTQKAVVNGNLSSGVEQNLVQAISSTNDNIDKKTKVYSGRRVTLEFADAEVRSIFQLLSEVSGKNFVLGDEIGGKISLKLVNVPWDQAFDIILTTKGFESQEQDNVMIVRGAGKLKSELDSVAEKRAAQLKSGRMITRKFSINYSNSDDVAAVLKPLVRFDWQGSVTSDKRTNTVIVNAVEQLIGDMEELVKVIDIPEKQVMIEARIIEASSDFSRSLGVSWGLGTTTSGSGGKLPFISDVSSVFGGIASVPGTSTIGSTNGAADISFGTIGANVKLSMRLNAAAKAGLIRIISSPKVATLNNKSAKITQGKQIPYISSTSDKVETKFVEAALSLEVTPHINNNGTIVLKIDAKNDSPDTTSTSSTPPINKKQATTEMLLRDGETTIIGGIFVDSESEGDEGLPWLMDVPILGNLFKSKSYSKSKSELLIFITPRILNTLI